MRDRRSLKKGNNSCLSYSEMREECFVVAAVLLVKDYLLYLLCITHVLKKNLNEIFLFSSSF